jgi:hypothetical protein
VLSFVLFHHPRTQLSAAAYPALKVPENGTKGAIPAKGRHPQKFCERPRRAPLSAFSFDYGENELFREFTTHGVEPLILSGF